MPGSCDFRMSGEVPVEVTEAETVAEIDEALTYMAAEWWAARYRGNEIRAQVVLRYIDKVLDRRLELASQ